ncbi:MAG: hypothetical protein ACREQ5_03375 [Candidatus Dormibacteria bacterium]
MTTNLLLTLLLVSQLLLFVNSWIAQTRILRIERRLSTTNHLLSSTNVLTPSARHTDTYRIPSATPGD